MAFVLTTSSTLIIGQIAWLLGRLMQGIYWGLGKIGIPNVGLAIIIFTIILLMVMMPLQIKQQRFSKLSTIMQPEIQKIQARYKGKKDQVSQQKMMDETNAVYAKYGVSQMGSCVQMLITLPVLFALYRVIYQIPGYITSIGDKIAGVANDSAFVDVFTKFVEENNNSTLTRNFNGGKDVKNIIDAVYGLTTKQWTALQELSKGQSFENSLTDVHAYVKRATGFLGLNISDSPMDIIKNAFADKPDFWILLIIAAILFPLLAWFTQMLTIKLMPQPAAQPGQEESAVSQSMKSMNNIMPIMSAFFCLTLPVGVGIYWIMSAVVRALQQYFINKKLDSESPEEIIKAAQEKANKKRAKQGLPPQKITSAAHVSTKTLEAERLEENSIREKNNAVSRKKMEEATAYYQNQSARPGSIASRANMVKAFDEKNGTKKK